MTIICGKGKILCRVNNIYTDVYICFFFFAIKLYTMLQLTDHSGINNLLVLYLIFSTQELYIPGHIFEKLYKQEKLTWGRNNRLIKNCNSNDNDGNLERR